MLIEIVIAAIKALIVIVMVLHLAGMLGWVERKGSALIQDRIGANRASIFGFAGAGLVNTLMADPLKFLTKEDVIPAGADRLLHTLAPCVGLFPALVTFAGDPVRRRAGRSATATINLQVGAAQRRHPLRARDGRRSASTASCSAAGRRTTAGRCSAASAARRR